MKSILSLLVLLILTSACSKDKGNTLDQLDPKVTTEKDLDAMDKEYEESTGKDSHIPVGQGTCYQINCPLFALVDKSTQVLTLYINGVATEEWLVSSGGAGHETPDFDKRPNGRIYEAYTSKHFPGGDYEGLGNMPYAVFIEGGYAVHGTTRGNFKRLGSKASHGCIRLHPDHAKIFNGLVRKYGVSNTWITIQ